MEDIMPEHDIELDIPTRIPVQRSDVEFKVEIDGDLKGTLAISQGAVEWIPYRNKYGHEMDWSEFIELMEEHGEERK